MVRRSLGRRVGPDHRDGDQTAVQLGAVAGPGLLRLIFGNEVPLDWFLSMLVAVGSAFALANLVMTIMIMAQGGSGKLARAWVVGVLGGVLVWVLSAQEPGAHRTLMLVMHVIFQHISISRCGWLLMELEAS